MIKKLQNLSKIYILTEASPKTGLGHIVRCLALQQAFQRKGVITQLIVNGNKQEYGWLLPSETLFFNWLEKPAQLWLIIKNSKLVVIDSYLAPLSFYKQITKRSSYVACVDDNQRLFYPSRNIIINGSICVKNLQYQNKIKFLGTRYAVLRKEFWQVDKKNIKTKINSVMITFGGGDFRALTLKILKKLIKTHPTLTKKIIVTETSPQLDEIKKLSSHKVEIISSPLANQMLQIMMESDVAISSSGQTLYELARTGVPTIAIIEADNQLNNAAGWSDRNFIMSAGKWDDPFLPEHVILMLQKLANFDTRKKISRLGRKVIDGQGSLRIVDELIKKTKL